MTALQAHLPPAAEERVAAAVAELTADDLEQFGAWQALADLSAHTYLDAIDGDPASVVVEGQRFSALANVYVLLVYGSGKDQDSFSDEYIATVTGAVTADRVVIDAVSVDVSPFYD